MGEREEKARRKEGEGRGKGGGREGEGRGKGGEERRRRRSRRGTVTYLSVGIKSRSWTLYSIRGIAALAIGPSSKHTILVYTPQHGELSE